MRLIVACVLSLILTGGHVHIVAQGGDYVGPLRIADHLFDIGLVLALLTVCAAVGLWSLERFGFTFDSQLEALLFSVAIGSGTISVSILILGFLSGMKPIILTGLMVSWLLFTKREIARICHLAIQASVKFKEQSDILTLTVLGIVAAFLLSQALLPPRDWDSLVYHLRAPALFLDAGKIYLPVDNENVAYVQLVHMLYLPLLAAGSVAGPALLSAFFALFLGLAVFALSERFFDAATAALSSTLLWASPMILLVAITPRVDVTLAYFLLLAHFALLKARMDWRSFYLSALLFGLAVGIKLSALLYAGVTGPLVALILIGEKKQITRVARELTLFGILLLLAALPWFLKNWYLFAAPLYPYFSRTRVDIWLTSLLATRNVVAIPDLSGWTVLSKIQAPFNFIDLFTNPGTLAPEEEATVYTTNPLFIALLLWPLGYLKNYYLTWLIIPALCYFLGFTLMVPITNLRYFTPVIAPFTIAAASMVMSRITVRFGLRLGAMLVQLLAVVMLVPTGKVILTWALETQNVAYLTGRASPESYLLKTASPPGYSQYARTVVYMNQHLPGDSRTLMLYEARGFYFKVPVIQDNTLTNWLVVERNLLSLPCFENTGITHLLINTGALDYYIARGVAPNEIKMEQFDAFAKKCLTIVKRQPGYDLYRLRHDRRE